MRERIFTISKYIIYLLMAICSLSLIWVRKSLIDGAVSGSSFKTYLFQFILLIVINRVLLILDQRYSAYFYDQLKQENEISLLNLWKDLPVSKLEENSFRNIFERCFSESDYKEKMIQSLASILYSILIILVTIIILFQYNNTFAGIVFLFTFLLMIIERLRLRKAGDIWVEYRKNMRKANYFSNILIDNRFLSERKIFGTTDFFNKKFSDEFSSASEENKKLGQARFSRDLIYEIFVLLLIICLILYFPKNPRKEISLGLLISLFYQLIEIKFSISELVSSYFTFLSAQIVEKDYEKNFKIRREDKGFRSLEKIDTVEFQDVYFSYPNSTKQVLKGVSFTLSPKAYGMVGENGSGKTTITKLLMGLYTATSGKILINGYHIKDYKKEDLKDQISTVFQNSYHYPGTFYDNLNFKEEALLDEELLESLEMNHVIEKLPSGIHTNLSGISEESVNLSGGEWQRLGILRALLSKASFYILDEPNALLDPLLEAKMYKKYLTILDGKLSLLISHRLGATSQVDEIIVLKDGKIYDIGSHEELMKTEYYKNLYNTQKEMYYE